MQITVSPTESQIFSAVRAFLLAALPAAADPNAWDAVLGQDNEVAEPATQNYVVMWPLNRPRLATNVDGFQDRAFMASISGAVMTVTEIEDGVLGPLQGAALFGNGVAAGSAVGAPISVNPDGTGTWSVSPSQTVASATLACGGAAATQEIEIIMQCDVHAATLQAAGDACAQIATLWRDPFAVAALAAQNVADGAPAGSLTPLYADAPRQVPFVNAESQYESRWTVDLHLQADQTVSGIPQQFADALSVESVSAETLAAS